MPHISEYDVETKFIDRLESIGYQYTELGKPFFTTEAPMGNVAQVPDDKPYILSQRTIAFNAKADLICDDFLAHLLLAPDTQKKLGDLATGGTA